MLEDSRLNRRVDTVLHRYKLMVRGQQAYNERLITLLSNFPYNF